MVRIWSIGGKRAQFLLRCGLLFAAISSACPVWGGGGPKNVIVVANNKSQISRDIAAYYMHARKIPAENLCTISCSTKEIVSKTECETKIIAPIREFLATSGIAFRADYIVLTKGVPLGANYGYSTGALSLTSILTCVGESGVTTPITNPYGPTASKPVETAFSHQLTLGGKQLYLVTRLDGYTLGDVYKMIDRSVGSHTPGRVALDRRTLSSTETSYVPMNDRLTSANEVLAARGVSTHYDDSSIFLSSMDDLIGYFSWGSNDPSFTLPAYRSNIFAPGSIADTYVSTSGRTFAAPTEKGQSLIGDLITLGACAVSGSVSEPYTIYATYPEVLFDRYTKGYNMAESFYAACPELFWKSVIVGDPLMAAFAVKPEVTIEVPDESIVDTVSISAVATHPSGISKVEFYMDNELHGTATSAPYTLDLDAFALAPGPHLLEVIAYENSPVATQGFASTVVFAGDAGDGVPRLGNVLWHNDGHPVDLPQLVVSAGTSDTGGGEFYAQHLDRSMGIRIISPVMVSEGDLVRVSGTLHTDSGERCVIAATVDVEGRSDQPILPLGMSNLSVGGGDFGLSTKGVTGGKGLRNIGLLIRTWGTVTYVGTAEEDFFYIDDGSGLDDGSGRLGLKVSCRNLDKPALGSTVVVTGLSGCEMPGSGVFRLLKPRRQSDIVQVTATWQ